MQAIKRKLRSRRGASLTFALLLFLVCAVLSSVIIVAASTAAGRMSNLADTDQRYYSVTSAAELMKDLMKEPVTIVQSETVTQNTIKTVQIIKVQADNPSGNPEDPPIEIENITESEMTQTLPKVTADYLINKDRNSILESDDLNDNSKIRENGARTTGSVMLDSIINDAAYRCSFDTDNLLKQKDGDVDRANKTRILMLSAGDSEKMLAVEIRETVDQNGAITLTIKNVNGDPYTLELTFVAQKSTGNKTNPIKIKEQVATEHGETEEGNPMTIITTTTTKVSTKTKSTTYNWKLERTRIK